MARFIQPRYFEPGQIDAIGALLDEMAISDEEGRRIFIIAVEYELAEYEKALQGTVAVGDQEPPHAEEVPPATVADPELDRLRTTAERLIGQLRSLPDATAREIRQRLQQGDPFQRRYEDLYLPSLQAELERLTAACGEVVPEAVADAGPVTAIDPAGRSFVLSVAEAFAECFEQDPRAVEAAAMYRLLQHIIDSCGLPLRLDRETLQRLLQDYDLKP